MFAALVLAVALTGSPHAAATSQTTPTISSTRSVAQSAPRKADTAPPKTDSAPPKTANVTAYGPGGRVLPSSPVLRPGERILVVATGFKPNGLVIVHTRPATSFLRRADSRHSVRLSYTVPRRTARGPYLITFQATSVDGPTPAPPRGRGMGDQQPITVSVPVIALFPYRVGTPPPPAPPSGGAGVSAGAGHGSDGHGSGGHLGNTGTDLALIVGAGALLLLLGAIVARRGRRRA